MSRPPLNHAIASALRGTNTLIRTRTFRESFGMSFATPRGAERAENPHDTGEEWKLDRMGWRGARRVQATTRAGG